MPLIAPVDLKQVQEFFPEVMRIANRVVGVRVLSSRDAREDGEQARKNEHFLKAFRGQTCLHVSQI